MSNTLVSIPLCALKRSKANVRKTDPAAEIEQLAASIASQGLLENLIVRPGSKNDTYDVIAGGRRLQALKLLAKQKKVPHDHPVACLLLETAEGFDLTEISLAENMVRVPIHPADQFDAFASLQKQGLCVDDIAARFGITPVVVLQRLRLATVAPALIAAYRDGEMNLEQLMAFAISDDHAAQQEVWHQAGGNASSRAIRQMLTKAQVEGSDRRALYIGARAYEEAGGTIVRDLFDQEHEGYFADSQLLDRLVLAKLNDEAETIHKEGWAWVEVRTESSYVDVSRYGRVSKIEVALSEADEAPLQILSQRYDELVANVGDDEDAELNKELDQVSEALEALCEKRETWPEEAKLTAGVVISLDYSGQPQVLRGLIKPEDRRRVAQSEETGNGATEPQAPKPANGLSESLVLDLSAHRTTAMQEMLAGNPVVALDALLYAMALRLFFEDDRPSCLAIALRTVEMDRLSPTVATSKAAQGLALRDVRWRSIMPEQPDLWSWIQERSCRDKLELLAYCTAKTLDATQRRGDQSPVHNAGEVAMALGLDMADWWRPTKDTYFDHVTKAQIAEAVAEACSPEAAHDFDGLKKAAMSAKAEALVAPTRWLPGIFRTITATPTSSD